MKTQEQYEKELLKEFYDKIEWLFVIYADTMEQYEDLAEDYGEINRRIAHRAQKINFDLHR